MSPELIWFALGLIVAGLAAGFVGGLFGIGGGIVIVPALYFVFTALGVDEAVRMHVAVGTSLSTIIATSWRSLSAHTKAGAVDFTVLRSWTPWISFGALLGAVAAGFANTEALLAIFGGGLLLIAAQ
ncbi:MAG: sulfite exporter TauE/SafE family protein, partial [Hyphomonadaceae bacterium]|nr:sulfite exporter TauE/SafE family protein [Hyphomonadaceae bacterium]